MKNEIAPTIPGLIYSRPKKVIRLHWFNAICWLVLTLSGLGIIRGSLRFMPVGYAEWVQNHVGGQFNLIVGHSLLGLLWAGVFALFVLFNWKSVVWPFLKRVVSITPMSVLRDMFQMAVDVANLFGLLKSVKLPPPGRYNGAQRLLGTMIIGSSMLIALTGTLMFVLFLFTPITVDGIVFRWSLVAHAFFVGLVYIGLVAHIYYAVVEEPESLRSMTDGYLDEAYVKRHCPGWYDELKKEGRV
ncbi:MAG: cytochrome b/b6 domain-containing protein [Gammaproteobacteria bacterium]|nr:cytochrome b/b6 domain-containing protein [Gammaproteobacteria bacterium]